ncbi:MAG: DUF418 domain-containing protein [Actinomycetes bacterium]|nr:MAG: hypothetical protein DIU60_07845 [Actinomycetota bacterium]
MAEPRRVPEFSPVPDSPAGRPPPRPRVRELDALRGLAICGIMVVNTWQHVRAATWSVHEGGVVDDVIGTLLQGRFYPIFSLLFGMSFVLFLDAARERTAHPRLALFMRLVVLACFGLLHQLVNDGEVLLPYAAFGLVLLLPLSYLPRWAALAAGLAGVAAGVAVHDSWLLIAGLFPLGMALVRYRPSPRLLGPSFAVAVVGAAAGLWLQAQPPAAAAPWLDPVTVSMLAALAGAAAYALGTVLVARASRAVSAALEPLGRMALTNYLTSTLFILAALPLLVRDTTHLSVLGYSAAVLAVQFAFGRWWLRTRRYGPLEWIWRCATWWRIVPNRRDPADPARYGAAGRTGGE